MTWDDDGYLISKKKYNENSLIVEFFTKNHGKVTGLIFGATSKKIKSYLFADSEKIDNVALLEAIKISSTLGEPVRPEALG